MALSSASFWPFLTMAPTSTSRESDAAADFEADLADIARPDAAGTLRHEGELVRA